MSWLWARIKGQEIKRSSGHEDGRWLPTQLVASPHGKLCSNNLELPDVGFLVPRGGEELEGCLLCPLTSMSSVFCRKRKLTDSRACCGHSWNQSMAVQFTMAGNFLLRTLSLVPTGEKQRVTWEGRRVGRTKKVSKMYLQRDRHGLGFFISQEIGKHINRDKNL